MRAEKYRVPVKELVKIAKIIKERYNLKNIYVTGSQSPRGSHFPSKNSDIDFASEFKSLEDIKSTLKGKIKDTKFWTKIENMGIANLIFKYNGREIHLIIIIFPVKMFILDNSQYRLIR